MSTFAIEQRRNCFQVMRNGEVIPVFTGSLLQCRAYIMSYVDVNRIIDAQIEAGMDPTKRDVFA
jgi:hypothetical protein